MSRIEKLGDRNLRSLMFTVGTLVAGILIVLIVFVLAVPSMTRSGTIQPKLGSTTFDAGSAKNRARTIAEAGPLLFSDVASGDRDIWLQHTGPSDTKGWLAFDARRSGTSRDCTLTWDVDGRFFSDPCNGEKVSADGSGLTHYSVTVNDDDHVIIDLRSEAESTATTDQEP